MDEGKEQQVLVAHDSKCQLESCFAITAKALHETLNDSSNSSNTLDTTLTEISSACFIVSKSWIEKSRHDRVRALKEQIQSNKKHFIVPRVSLNAQENIKESDSLLAKFSALSLKSETKTSSTSDNIYEAFAQIIANEILQEKSCLFPSNTSEIQNKSMVKLPGMIFGKAKSAIKSFMASYDLTEDSTMKNIDNANVDEDDDANAEFDDSIIDEDDAGAYSSDAQISKGPKEESRNSDHIVSQEDYIWNIRLLIESYKLILSHVEAVIADQRKNGDDDGLTTTKSDDVQSNAPSSGILLDRYGIGPRSFLQICRNAGTEKSTILQHLSHGPALEIILHMLLATNKAKLTPDKDIIILFPTFVTKDSLSSNEIQVEGNESDIAIFKLNHAIQSLEKRIEVLSKRSTDAQKKALECKNKSNNVKLALIHMKRHKAFLKEIENCAGILLNLENGLNSIRRAKNDIEMISVYELMKSSMKTLREDIDSDRVEDIMDELKENKDELDALHDSLHASSGDIGVSNDELEKELLELMNNDNFVDCREEEDNAPKSPSKEEQNPVCQVDESSTRIDLTGDEKLKGDKNDKIVVAA
ncbi:hypothetical protein CTEN210_14384 [Chaetoceros tenuissimus]|uniref:SNF7 family protein n=1 Tax=Chaetoceros tenuissimus TaxID=426638 RepID=A0AAD3D524_9STRA|nr:hypothetical protein CTEN210_14384 [Chaetoceros tenuissimus]